MVRREGRGSNSVSMLDMMPLPSAEQPGTDASAHENSLTLLSLRCTEDCSRSSSGFMNDSLDVGTCRDLPLIESTRCFWLPGNQRPRIINGGQGNR